jgi:hypothetical protein
MFNLNTLFADQKVITLNDSLSDAIVLQGKLVLKEFFGPPNYGENPGTDKIETYYILVLFEPLLINLQGHIETIFELQVIFNSREVNMNIDSTSVYTIVGNLLKAQSGHHHTEVVVILSGICT